MKTVIAFTTITRKVQQAAQQAVRNNVLDSTCATAIAARQMS